MDENIIKQCLGTAKLLGYLIAKALLERIPINCHLNHTIWRQLLQQRIIIDDLYSYDKEVLIFSLSIAVQKLEKRNLKTRLSRIIVP